MARLAAEGHRVVVIVATRGEYGLVDEAVTARGRVGDVRMAELHASARALGCARVHWLGYGDSGLNGSGTGGSGTGGSGTAPPVAFARADVTEAAERLAAQLRAEGADLLTSYDPAGGYGHPDHVAVHRVGALAARLAGTPILLEATVDRRLLAIATALLARLPGLASAPPPGLGWPALATGYVPSAEITHRIRVGRHIRAKRASMAAYVSQRSGGEGPRTLSALLRLPFPLFRWALGTEWFVQRDLGEP